MHRIVLATASLSILLVGASPGWVVECGPAANQQQNTATVGTPSGLRAAGGQQASVAQALSPGTLRQPQGQQGTSADINIGRGELQECTISKPVP